jgi:hypothetical protein
VLPKILRKPAHRDREIEKSPPWHVAHAADHQRSDHRPTCRHILAHGLLERSGDALDRAGRRQAEFHRQRLIGEEGVGRAKA